MSASRPGITLGNASRWTGGIVIALVLVASLADTAAASHQAAFTTDRQHVWDGSTVRTYDRSSNPSGDSVLIEWDCDVYTNQVFQVEQTGATATCTYGDVDENALVTIAQRVTAHGTAVTYQLNLRGRPPPPSIENTPEDIDFLGPERTALPAEFRFKTSRPVVEIRCETADERACGSLDVERQPADSTGSYAYVVMVSAAPPGPLRFQIEAWHTSQDYAVNDAFTAEVTGNELNPLRWSTGSLREVERLGPRCKLQVILRFVMVEDYEFHVNFRLQEREAGRWETLRAKRAEGTGDGSYFERTISTTAVTTIKRGLIDGGGNLRTVTRATVTGSGGEEFKKSQRERLRPEDCTTQEVSR